MNRTFLFLSAALGVAGALSYALAQPPGGGAPAPAAAAPAPTRPTVAVFNMAAVMRDFGQAKYQVWLLTHRKNDMSKNMIAWRGEFIKLRQVLASNPNHPEKDKIDEQIRQLAHKIEDEDQKVSKELNKLASDVISDLYDKMKVVVDKIAEMNGYHIVFAYPDAVTQEEQKNPYLKELKLKPPAAQPFYVAPHADITGIVVQTLNKWYPPTDAQGKLIDVSKLPKEEPQGAPPGTPGATAAPGATGGAPPAPQPGIRP